MSQSPGGRARPAPACVSSGDARRATLPEAAPGRRGGRVRRGCDRPAWCSWRGPGPSVAGPLGDRAHRRRDDGEPLVRPLPRLAARRRRQAGRARRTSTSTASRTRPTASRRTSRAAGTPTRSHLRRRPGRSTTAGAATAGCAPATTTCSRSATTRRATCPSSAPPRRPGRSATATSRRSSARRSRTASTCTRRGPTGSTDTARAEPTCRRSGTGSRARASAAATTTATSPSSRSGATKYSPITRSFAAVPRATAAAGTLPAVAFVDPPSAATGSGRSERRPSARRHPRRASRSCQPGLRGRHVEPGLAADAAGDHLRRVGRLLRPRPAAGRAPTSTRAHALRGFRVPTVLVSPFARRGHVATASTTTPRS